MERDDEAKGPGNSYDFGARFYDSRLGRWLSRDALESNKADLSPYQSFRNNPLLYNDPDGNDEFISIIVKDHKGKTLGIIRGYEAVSNKVRAGAITEAGNSTTIYENQKLYDFRRVHTVTINQDGTLSFDPKPSYHTLLDRPQYSRTMLFSSISAFKEGSIIDPDELNSFFQKGGWYMTGSGGQGTKYFTKKPEYVGNIDDLLAAFDRYGPDWKPSQGKKVLGGDAWEVIDILMKTFERQAGIAERILEINEAIKKEVRSGGTSDEMKKPDNKYDSNKITDTLFHDDGKTITPLTEGTEPANLERNNKARKLYYENQKKDNSNK